MQEAEFRPAKVHKFLDAKPEFLWWELDDIVIITLPLIIGIMLDHPIYGLSVSMISVTIYKKLKEGSQEGFIMHFLYHIGLMKWKSRPDSWMKEFTE